MSQLKSPGIAINKWPCHWT